MIWKMRVALLALVMAVGCSSSSSSSEDRAGAAAELRGLGFPAGEPSAEQVRDVLARHHAVPDAWTHGPASIAYSDDGATMHLWKPIDPNAPPKGGGGEGFTVWFDGQAQIKAAHTQWQDSGANWHDP